MSQLLTIGETMISFIPDGNEPLQYGPTLKMRIAGAESNTAIGVQKLGHSVSYLTRVGNDNLGAFLLRMIRAEGVDTSYIKTDPNHPTGIMIKELLPRAETSVSYYRTDSAATYLSIKDVPTKAIADAEILHFTGITPILSPSCQEMIFHAMEVAQANNCAISFDPNIRTKLWKNHDYIPLMHTIIAQSNFVLLGLDEANILYGTKDITKLVDILSASKALRFLAIKDGAQGAWVSDFKETLHIPCAPCQCIDPIGAGDAFNAGFLSGLLKNAPLATCGAMGAILGAKATETSGDIEGLITEQEMQNLLNNISPASR